MKQITIITLGISLVLLAYLPFLKIKDIALITPKQNNSRTIEVAFNKLLDKHILNILINKSRFKQNMLDQFPSIKHISFWITPNLTLNVHLRFKTARFLCISNDSTDIFSSDGTLLNDPETLLSLEHIQDLLIIKGLNASSLSTISEYLDDLDHLHKTILKHLPSKNLQLDFSEPYNLMITVNDSIPIYIGDDQDLNIKLNNLTTFLNFTSIALENVAYIDLRVPDKVITKNKIN